MEINQSDINNNINNNPKIGISPVTKMKIITAEKTKKESQYWLDNYKFKQNLLKQLELLKNEKPEKIEKISQISTFSTEQEILCDNLFKLNKLTNFSQIKLGKNLNQMKEKENNEEVQKKKLKDVFEKNLETIKNIEKNSEEISAQNGIFNTYNEYIENYKTKISDIRKENFIKIDSLCNQYSQDNKEFKKISKLYNLLCNITKYRVFNIVNDENDPQTQLVKGYLLNAKNGNIMSYNMKMKNNESIENKAMKVFNFWKTFIEFNKNSN